MILCILSTFGRVFVVINILPNGDALLASIWVFLMIIILIYWAFQPDFLVRKLSS